METGRKPVSYTISIRTFQRDVDTIRELFLIDIRYSRTEGLYAINDEFSDEVQPIQLPVVLFQRNIPAS